MTDMRDRLREIKTFPSLVKFLRDELDWPIDSTDDFEDLTFDYTPEELGIDAANAAKIDEIKRLRPLSHHQPWGIFFVKFEPKQLPVVALRRILNRVVVRKRATGSAAEQQRWATDDLLFISAYGDEAERRISFAHFSQDPGAGDLATLKVLAWDDQDTGLRLDDVANRLVDHLSWPDEAAEWDDETWRERWSAAFELRHREVITTSKVLAIRLAELARAIRTRINAVLEIESDDGPVTKLMDAFREALVHDLEPDDFADMYAQTIAYGLLSARIANPTGRDSAAHLPVTNPFLKELMETFLHVGSTGGASSGEIDFDELGVSEVVALLDDAKMEAVILDFGDKNPLEDPVIHFYQLFLEEYDAQMRMDRGVFYTPRPVVSYIVRSIHELLRTEFALADGLADTASWGEVVDRLGVQIPDGVERSSRFVTILDPATGTGTFLVETIDVIYRTLVERWSGEGKTRAEIRSLWNEYVPTQLLPRLHGFELMMAPYAIAHLKIGLKLIETGYEFESTERARVFLTNALEPPQDFSDRLEFAVPALAHEAEAVNAVKARTAFTVVVGNPPYAQMSQNLGPAERELVEPYRYVDGVRIVERGAITLERNLQDDYVKFVRLAELKISSSGVGVAGLITNHVFLGSRSLRGMRAHLLTSFSNLWFLDLHGNSKINEEPPGGVRDENVFDIQQGVAVSLLSAGPRQLTEAHYSELWGDREAKYARLVASAIGDTNSSTVYPSSPLYLFVPRDDDLAHEFENFLPLPQVFPIYGSAITTARDSVVVDMTDAPILERVAVFRDEDRSDDEVLDALRIRESAIWRIGKARAALRGVDLEQSIVDVDYRPFDTRRLFYNDALVSSPRHPTMDHMTGERSLALAVCRQQSVPGFRHVFVSRRRFDEGLVSNRSREKTVCFPLYLADDSRGAALLGTSYSPNVGPDVMPGFGRLVGADGQPFDESAALVLMGYVYAVLHSPGYRVRYEQELMRDFPRIPIPRDVASFRALSEFGRTLIFLHLLEDIEEHAVGGFDGPPRPFVDRATWADETIWLEPGTAGWKHVSRETWEYRIGAYQVCEKWLKDRRGRTLSPDEILHYQKIVVAITDTIRLMTEIDQVIDDHGGWPGAFHTVSVDG